MANVNIDERDFYCCTIDFDSFIDDALGSAIDCPPLEDHDDWACDKEAEILEWLNLKEGKEYVQVARNNTYNHENDLSHDFVYTVYCSKDDESRDWIWNQDNAYVIVEKHHGGDPRNNNYALGKVYRVDSLGDSNFFNWMLSWSLTDPKNPDIDLDEDGRFQEGYSQNPTYRLGEALEDTNQVFWSKKLERFVSKTKEGQFIAFSPWHY